MTNAAYEKIDEHVAEYLTFRGFHELAQQFKQLVKQPEPFPDIGQTVQLFLTLARSGSVAELQKAYGQFMNTFVRQNKGLLDAGQQLMIELFKLCLYFSLVKKQPGFQETVRQLQRQYPGEFDVFAREGNLKKNEQIACYEQELVQQQIECQLNNLVSFAFTSRKLPALYSVVGSDFEKLAMLSEIMSLRNQIDAIRAADPRD